MAYMSILFNCRLCGRLASGNPDKVITVRVSVKAGTLVVDANATAQPVCRSCADSLNEARRRVGKPPFPVAADAYESQECS